MPEEALQGLQIAIRYPDGRTEQLVVDANSVLVGSGAHCEVRLPAEHAAIEHATLSLVGGGVHAQAQSFTPHPTINGVGFVQTPVLPESVIGIGGIQMWIRSVELGDRQQGVIRKKAQKTSPITYVAAAIGFPLAIYMLAAAPSDDSTQTVQGTPPALWGEPVNVCPQQGRDAALAVGLDKFSVAVGKRERRPFHVEDGVAAVPLFETAGACFRVAGRGPAAAESSKAAAELRTKINEDYRAHQVRLEHALMVSDWTTAQQEVSVLRAFTAGKPGQYVVWLSNLDRRLQLKLGRKEGSS
ncbi:MAG TPA: FHA domain-containing protein [Polyangiaceae bacterium]